MSRTTRLFRLMDALRGRRTPVTAAHLAKHLSVSARTIYRDVQALIDLGARIDGGAGVGYVLRKGFFLPPLMFGEEEIEALVLGARWVAGQGDPALARAAESVLAKGTCVVAAWCELREDFRHFRTDRWFDGWQDASGALQSHFSKGVTPPKFTLLTSGNLTSASQMIRTP
jgi:predicted DNA-binding transcriptional regulator YafY